jgi:NADH:ubiquinone oxidoreductase subunit E
MSKIKTPAELQKERAKLIEHMLCGVEDEMADRGRSNDFIESLRAQFDKDGWLTEKQLQALHKFYERAC